MARQRNRSGSKFPPGALLIGVLVVGLCILIILLGVRDLYDVVRYSVAALVIAYFGRRWLPGTKRKEANHDQQ